MRKSLSGLFPAVILGFFLLLMILAACLFHRGITVLDFYSGPRPFFSVFLLLVIPVSVAMIIWSFAVMQTDRRRHRIIFYTAAAILGSLSLISVIQTIRLYQSV